MTCTCKTGAERGQCAACCLDHLPFTGSPWPAPGPEDALRQFVGDGWHTTARPLPGFPGEYIYASVRFPGPPDPNAPRAPRTAA